MNNRHAPCYSTHPKSDSKESQIYIPTFNLTLEYKSGSEIKRAEKIAKKTKLTGYKRSAKTNQVKFKHR